MRELKILLSGCSGKMGAAVIEAAPSRQMRVVAGIDPVQGRHDFPVFATPAQCDVEADVIIDFSRPDSMGELCAYAVDKRLPLVIATTGLGAQEGRYMAEASRFVPVFSAPNFSIGVALLHSLAQKAAAFLGDDFDIEIVEAHHSQKVDAPSGTALSLARGINEALDGRLNYTYGRHGSQAARSKRELGIHAVRGGSIPGDHEVMFCGQHEVLSISHRAQSRALFAVGALRAAQFVVGKSPRIYSMEDLVGEI